MSNTPIHDFIKKYANAENIRCHMPGIKYDNLYDITEIYGADSLYDANGIIYESEQIAAKHFGSGATVFSAGGSTLSIMAMLMCVGGANDTILANRYSHRSFINTAILMGYNVKFIYPKENLEEILRNDKNIKAFFTATIDYYGGECDTEKIAHICHKYDVKFLADNAHGAYKVFTGDHPIKLGADFSADSAHKTLPALTGASYLHMRDKNYREKAKAMMSLVGSSSPSYLILQSLDLCNEYISKDKNNFPAFKNIENLKEKLTESGIFLEKSDALRITINAAKHGYSGERFAEILRKNKIECEMSDSDYVVLLFSVIQRESDFEKIYEVIANIPRLSPKAETNMPILKPKIKLSPREAFYSNKITIPIENALGKICGEIFAPCPPGIPMIMAGEVIGNDELIYLKSCGREKIEIVSI